MPVYLVKQKGIPATWGCFAEDRLSLSFSQRSRATEFPSPEAALDAFDAACSAMWVKVLEADAKAAERDKKAGRSVPVDPTYARGKGPAPAWLLRKMGRRTRGFGSGGDGQVNIDTVASALDAAEPTLARYVKSEKGWLGGPATKARWGLFDWRQDFSLAIPFMDDRAVSTAIRMAPTVLEINVFHGRCEFVHARLSSEAKDHESLAIAAAVEKRAIAGSLTPEPNPENNEPFEEKASSRRARI